MSLSVKLHFEDIKLALCLVVLFTEAVNLMLFRVELDPVPSFDVFLDLHPHNVSVDRQGHLVGHGVDLSLLLLNSTPHVIQSLLDSHLELLLGLDLLGQPFLKLIRLASHLLIVALEVHVKSIDLLFLSNSCLQVPLNCTESSLKIIILLSELLKHVLLHGTHLW